MESPAWKMHAPVGLVSIGLGSPEDSLELGRDPQGRCFSPENCLDEEREDEELLPTTEDEDLSDGSTY
jgi:hypothetical protein